MKPLRSPKDEGDKHVNPHPNRQATLRDLLELEVRLKDAISKIGDLNPLATKKDLLAMEHRLKDELVDDKELLATEVRLSRLIKQPRFDWTIGIVQSKVQKKKEIMEIQLTNEQQVTVTLTPKTSAGKPATLDGVPTWEVITGESTVTASADGLSALIVSSDNPGDTQILVKADADLGEGVVEISEVLDVHVAGAQAANLGVSVGTPELKP